MSSQHKTFVFLTALVVFGLVLPDYVQHGMFLDGTQYAIVSKNLANGQGSFWKPFLSNSWIKSGNPYFLEHPPLFYFIQSVFFSLFGNSVFIEKFYCFCNLLFCVILIRKIWILCFHSHSHLKPYWWLAVLLWFITPSVFWSFRNNMIENTLSVFVLASVFFSLKSILLPSKWSLVYLLVSGLFVFLATLTKGLPGLFPIGLIFCYHVTFNAMSLRKTFVYTALLLIVPTFCYALLLLFNSEAFESLNFYFQHRLLNRIGNAPLVENRFTILFWLLTDLFVDLGVLILLFIFFKWLSFFSEFLPPLKRLMLFFLLLGFAGVLPLCLTKVQRATYFVPALPFFGMAFAVFIAQAIQPKFKLMTASVIKTLNAIALAILLIGTVVIIKLSGENARDELILADVHAIHKSIGENMNIGVPMDVYCRWDFQFYLLRYHNITLFPLEQSKQEYVLFDKGHLPNDAANFDTVSVTLNRYQLLKRK